MMANQEAGINEVTLVLGDDRIKADKNKLVRYSLYFASLFSEKYSDHRQEEFKINYEVSLRTLQFLNSDFDTIERMLGAKRRHYMQCIAGLNNEREDVLVAAWTGRSVQTIAKMTESVLHTMFDDNGKPMVGRQVVGRGFSIYLVGGEQGIGTGRFNPALWRYCLFSKKWYIESLFPRPRRHMAVAFIKNKLYLFGGVGRNRLKLNSVDVFDVHTGSWSVAQNIPEEFTEVPPSCVVNDKFVYFKTRFHVYNPRKRSWSSSGTSPEDGMNLVSDFQVPTRSIVGYRDDGDDKIVLFIADVVPEHRTTLLKRYLLETTGSMIRLKVIHQWKSKDGPSTLYKQIMDGQSLVSFCYCEDAVYVEVGEVRVNELPDDADDTDDANREPEETYRRLRTYRKTFDSDGPDKAIQLRIGCFNLIDPKTLHALFPLTNEESIDV